MASLTGKGIRTKPLIRAIEFMQYQYGYGMLRLEMIAATTGSLEYIIRVIRHRESSDRRKRAPRILSSSNLTLPLDFLFNNAKLAQNQQSLPLLLL